MLSNWRPAVKPALPWVICAIGSLLLLVLFGSGRAMVMAGILALVNALVALGLGGGWRTTRSRAVAKNNARQFLLPSLVFLVILCVIGLIRIHQLFLSPR